MSRKSDWSKLDTLSLRSEGKLVSFVAKRMEDIALEAEAQLQHPHRHAYYTIIWVRTGKGKHQVDFKSYDVRPDTIFFISPDQVHHLMMEDPHSGYVFLFTVDFLEQQGIGTAWVEQTGFFYRCDDVAPLDVGGHPDTQWLKTIAEHIESEYSGGNRNSEEVLATLVRLFLLICQRIQGALPAPAALTSRRHPLVRQFRDLLDQHYADWHMVGDYAKALHITANYLNEILSVETGHSAKKMILSRIMLEARRLATHSDIPVKMVAFQLGFDDPSHFTKLFRQVTGASFSHFRDDFRKKYP